MTVRIGINGFGRIGRLVFRVMQQRGADFEIMAINDLADAKQMAHLLKYDSVHGVFPGEITASEGQMTVNGKKVRVTAERDPGKLPWKELEVDFAVESTGVFRTRDKLQLHLDAGAKKVLLTVPSKDPVDATIVLGVNDGDLKAEHQIISNASCTTNCLAPVVKVLHDNFGLEDGLMTTVHAYTNDQNVADQIHKDMRRARAAAANIIPTTTGAAKAVGKVIPEMDGKLNGYALRVPVPDGSIIDLTATLKKSVTVQAINDAMKAAAEGPMKGYLEYTEDPIVSSDIVGNSSSSIFDSLCTLTMGDKFAKVVSWYDNEWGYSNRVVDLIQKAHNL